MVTLVAILVAVVAVVLAFCHTGDSAIDSHRASNDTSPSAPAAPPPSPSSSSPSAAQSSASPASPSASVPVVVDGQPALYVDKLAGLSPEQHQSVVTAAGKAGVTLYWKLEWRAIQASASQPIVWGDWGNVFQTAQAYNATADVAHQVRFGIVIADAPGWSAGDPNLGCLGNIQCAPSSASASNFAGVAAEVATQCTIIKILCRILAGWHPNNPEEWLSGTPKTMADILNAAVPVVQAVNPNIRVDLGPLSPVDGENGTILADKYVQAVFDAGLSVALGGIWIGPTDDTSIAAARNIAALLAAKKVQGTTINVMFEVGTKPADVKAAVAAWRAQPFMGVVGVEVDPKADNSALVTALK